MKLSRRLAVAGLVGAVASALAAVAIQVVIPVESILPDAAARIRAGQIEDAARISIQLAIRLIPLCMAAVCLASWWTSERTSHGIEGFDGTRRPDPASPRFVAAKITTRQSLFIAAPFACLIAVSLVVTHPRPDSLNRATSDSVLAFLLGLPVSSGLGLGLSPRGSKMFTLNAALLGTWSMFIVAVAMFLMHLA